MNHDSANALSFAPEPRRLALAVWLAVSALIHMNALLLCSRNAAAAAAPAALEMELAQEPAPKAVADKPERNYVDMPEAVPDETPAAADTSNIGLRNLLARDHSDAEKPGPEPKSDIGVDAPVYHLGGPRGVPSQESQTPPAQPPAEQAKPLPPESPAPESESARAQPPPPQPPTPPAPASPPAAASEPAVQTPEPDLPAAPSEPAAVAMAPKPAPAPPEPQPKPEPEPELKAEAKPEPKPKSMPDFNALFPPEAKAEAAPPRPRIAARVPGSPYTLTIEEEAFIPKTPHGGAALRGAPQYNVKWDEYAPYYKRLFAHIRAAMELRERLSYRRPLLLAKPRRIAVSFKLLRDGRFEGLNIDEDGGLPLVASDLASGVRSASPADAFPPYIKEDSLDIQIRVYVE
ncbi:MAG TPA: hypothetical protein P5137_02125 [Candidatus Brocadiia bacterium]|mgnify:CR=1 FL=1|nr:hypothetical protein [Candidatus Brocadiia bacterium]